MTLDTDDVEAIVQGFVDKLLILPDRFSDAIPDDGSMQRWSVYPGVNHPTWYNVIEIVCNKTNLHLRFMVNGDTVGQFTFARKVTQ